MKSHAAANSNKRAKSNIWPAPRSQPISLFDTFVLYVVTGLDLTGEISTFRTIRLSINIHWPDFERALSDTTANTWQAVDAGFPCGYEVTYDRCRGSNGGCGSDGDGRGHCWLWIFKVAGQKATIRTPYRRLSSQEEFTELRDVYRWEKVLKKEQLWEQDLKETMGLGKRKIDESTIGLVILHVCPCLFMMYLFFSSLVFLYPFPDCLFCHYVC